MRNLIMLRGAAALVLTAAFTLAGAGRLLSAEDSEQGVKKHGVVHNIAEDRRVEKVGGLYEPEGLDIYLKRHVDALGAQIRGVESRLDAVNKKLDDVSGRLRALTESLKDSSAANAKQKRS